MYISALYKKKFLDNNLAASEFGSPFQLFLTCKCFHKWGFLGKRKIIFGVAPWKKVWETMV
jgi:hypothetical protein